MLPDTILQLHVVNTYLGKQSVLENSTAIILSRYITTNN